VCVTEYASDSTLAAACFECSSVSGELMIFIYFSIASEL
jgi:hypothetical protein